jgi:hypothetical protein
MAFHVENEEQRRARTPKISIAFAVQNPLTGNERL